MKRKFSFLLKGITIAFVSGMSFTIKAQVPALPTDRFPLEHIENLPANIFITKLDNGLEVLVIEDNTVPLANIELAVHNGAFVQTPELSGLAHLYEHMFFKANKDYPSQEAYLDRINELGISFNGTTSEERVNYFITLNKAKLKDGLQFMNSSARYPKFLPEEMHKEDSVVAGEFQRNESNPVFYLFQDMNKRLWGKEYSRKNTIGDYKVIYSATPETMQKIKDRYYYPNNSLLLVAGDVKHDEVFDQVATIFGDWKPSTFNIFETYPVPDFDRINYSQHFITDSKTAQVPYVLISYQGPDTRKSVESTYAADVFTSMLSQQSSRLQKALVDSGLAYQVNVFYSTQKYTGPISVLMVPNPQRMKEAMAVLNREMSAWSRPGYFTEAQLERAKEMLEIDDLYSKEQVTNYMHNVSFAWASSSLEYFANYIDNIKRVSMQDIDNFIASYITGKPSIIGVMVSPALKAVAGLDSFYQAAENIESYKIGFNDTKSDKDQKIKGVAALMKINPSVRLQADIYGAKKKVVEAETESLKQQLAAAGVAESRMNIVPHVNKDKKLSEEEKPLQNTIQFKLF
jgi:zinc protease